MRRMIIADAHVGQREGDADEMLALLERLPALGIGELILLGDSFCYLLGFEKFWSPDTRRVLKSLAELRRQGVRVVALEGNRDFFLDTPALAPSFDETGLTIDRQVGSRSMHFDHGDRINQRDTNYRMWRALSKSRPARLWASLLPKALALKIVVDMERRLRNTNQKFRTTRPELALKEAAKSAWERGVDRVFWGHFHLAWSIEDDGRRAEILPAWLETGAVALIEADGEVSLRRTRSPEAMIPVMSVGLTDLPAL